MTLTIINLLASLTADNVTDGRLLMLADALGEAGDEAGAEWCRRCKICSNVDGFWWAEPCGGTSQSTEANARQVLLLRVRDRFTVVCRPCSGYGWMQQYKACSLDAPTKVDCFACSGRGWTELRPRPAHCQRCGGRGEVDALPVPPFDPLSPPSSVLYEPMIRIACRACQGSGNVPAACPQCGGWEEVLADTNILACPTCCPERRKQ